MGVEIERKFLLKDDSWKKSISESFNIVQGYLSREKGRTVRIRRKGDEAFITIKGVTDADLKTPEFEYAIPLKDFDGLIKLALPGVIEKTRHIVMHDGMRWEIDVFGGAHKGLDLAEIELTSKDQSFAKPAWLGEEVTGQPRYTNAVLSAAP